MDYTCRFSNRLSSEGIKQEKKPTYRGINVVEIDPTRSPHRLIESRKLEQFPDHAAIHIPGEALKPLALLLRREIVIRVEPQTACDAAYQPGNSA